MKKLYSALIISTVVSLSSTAMADEKHYMPHSADGPQGHMMEGKEHKAGMAENDHPVVPTNEVKGTTETNAHYMSHPGDGSQGHMMKGQQHDGTAEDHQEQFGDGKQAQPNGKHYMMETGDGDQGRMMKGDKHPSNN